MAISFSSRVRRNLAQQMAFSHRVSSATSSRYSIQALLLISNQVAVPTQSDQLFNYLNTCLNNSPHDGTAGANWNQQYILAYRIITTTEAATMMQTGTAVQLTTPWNMVVNNSGTIGSAMMVGITQESSNGLSLSNNVGGATTSYSAVLPNLDTNRADSEGSIMMSKACTLANYNLYAPECYSSFNFITDSVATSGTPFVKVSSMTTTIGQPLQLTGFKIRLNNFN
jgi:hypothetical protein